MRKCECGRDVFGTDKNTNIGYCASHQWKRTDKPKRSVLRHSDKKPVHSIDFGFENQTDLFAALWENSKDEHGIVTCPYTGERLNSFYNTDRWVNCFAHVLNKKNYIYFKLNPRNIRIVLPEFHYSVDQGCSAERCEHAELQGWRYDLWYLDIEKMKEEYAVFKKQNLLA